MQGTIHCQFSFERLRPSWAATERAEQDALLSELQLLLTRHQPVRVDQFLPENSHPDCDFVLRWESDNPEALRNLVLETRASALFRHIETVRTMSGQTRLPRYADAGLLRELTQRRPSPAPKKWAFLFSISRTADWAHFPEGERRAMVQEHVTHGLEYSDALYRCCYYSEGLDTQQDYVYYMEANDPGMVQEAYDKLKMLREGRYWGRHEQVLQAIPVTLLEWQEHLQMRSPAATFQPAPVQPEANP